MIKNISEIESSLGLPAGEFKKMYEDKAEREIPLTDFEIVKKADLQDRMKNYANDEFKKKKDSILEIYNKEVFRDVFGMEIDKTEDSKSLAAKAREKILLDAKIEPSKKVQELESDLNKLRENSKGWETKHNELVSQMAKEKQQYQIEGTVSNALPKVKTKIPLQDMKVLFELKYKPALNESGQIVFHNDKGEVLKNASTLNPKTIDEVMAEFQTPYIETASGGSGGSDNPGQVKEGGYDAFAKEMESKGISVGSQAFNVEMRSRIAAKTLKM